MLKRFSRSEVKGHSYRETKCTFTAKVWRRGSVVAIISVLKNLKKSKKKSCLSCYGSVKSRLLSFSAVLSGHAHETV